MPEPCGRTFDEALLSGYLDGALVQGDEQRVRVHLEDCNTCRTLVEELAELRGATMSSTFNTPGDHEWSEAPRTEASRLIRGLGWPLVIVWAILVGTYAMWQGWLESENLIEQLILVGGVSGFAMLLLGILLDRLKAMRTDPYREVDK
jgi:predicted anti-sigma-YlaC factor YlaD|tara:strand:+ start:180 stop:623 length:444 start_codon:yes stop_codon:yes gene_type:complete